MIVSKGAVVLTDFHLFVQPEGKLVGGNMGVRSPTITGVQAIPLKTWMRVAFTWDGNFWRLYVNGKLDAEMPATLIPNSSPNPVKLGRHEHIEGPFYFHGRIDEVRFSPVARDVASLTVTSLKMFAGLAIIGPIGGNYRIEFLNEIQQANPWLPLTTLTLTSSPHLFVDLESEKLPKRFYRVRPVP